VVLLGSSLLASAPAFAQPHKAASPEATRDAGKHFQRGVALFNEADYAGALAEFKKAHELSPNPAVLFNIGQTHFQLRAYATALQVFERYLAESGPSAEHRADAEANVETLRARVGKIDLVAPDGTEVTVDDEVAGKTPLPPIMAAVGRRKITVFKDGNQQVRFAEVSAGETVRVEIKAGGVEASNATRTEASAPAPASGRSGSALPTVLWIGTGVLVAGAVTTGVLALGASSSLADERGKPAGATTRGKLDDLESKTATLALVTDILAGAAIVTGGVALYLTVTAKPSRTGALPPPLRPGLDLRVGVNRLALEGRF
jgi:hypothetical protein